MRRFFVSPVARIKTSKMIEKTREIQTTKFPESKRNVSSLKIIKYSTEQV